MILSLNGIIAGKGVSSTLPINLRSVYKAENNANDSLGAYNGTAQGGLTYTTGKSGNAFNFNGSNAYIQLPDNSFNIANDFSYSFWLYMPTTGLSTQGIFMNFGYDGSNFYGFGVNHDTYLRFRIFNGTDPGVNAITFDYVGNGYTNGWHLITFTHKHNTGNKIYIDGALMNSNTNTISPSYYSTMKPVIGAFNYGPGFSNLVQYYMMNNSKVDELNVWNKELTSTEITELYNSGSGKFYPY